MADPRFFRKGPALPLAQVANVAGASLSAGVDPAALIEDVAPLETAGPRDLAFFDNQRYLDAFSASRAGFCLVRPRQAGRAPAGMVVLATETPYKAYARVAQAFYPVESGVPGISPRAHVDATAVIGDGSAVAAGAVIEAGAELGARCTIGPNAVIGRNVRLGDDVQVGACASLAYCLVGDRVTIHPGVRIGQDGFGFAPDPHGHVKVPQLGRVIIEDDVDIGANTTIDRGSGPDTVIGAGTWIDNLVQIGHNVRLGRGCILAGQVGISGSTRLDDFVACGGQAGLAGHLHLGTGAQLAARSGLMHDVPAGATYCGTPAMPIKQFFRQVATLARLAERKGKTDE